MQNWSIRGFTKRITWSLSQNPENNLHEIINQSCLLVLLLRLSINYYICAPKMVENKVIDLLLLELSAIHDGTFPF